LRCSRLPVMGDSLFGFGIQFLECAIRSHRMCSISNALGSSNTMNRIEKGQAVFYHEAVAVAGVKSLRSG
jgi:hypothetical protein